MPNLSLKAGEVMKDMRMVIKRPDPIAFLATVRSIFSMLDKDDSGRLDREELRSLVRKIASSDDVYLGNAQVEAQVASLIDDFGDKKQGIGFLEFIPVLQQAPSPSPTPRIPVWAVVN